MDDTPRLEPVVIVNCALNVLLIIASITGNTLVLFIILKTPSHRLEPSFIFLCSLALSDLFVGFIAQPFYIASEVTRRETILYHLSHVAAFFACGVSLCTTAALSMDRLAALHFHMRYSSLVTVPRVLCALVMVWVINVLLSSIYFANWQVTYIIMTVGIGTCVLISTFSYVKIYQIVRRHQRQIQRLQPTEQPQIQNNQITPQTYSRFQSSHRFISRFKHLQTVDPQSIGQTYSPVLSVRDSHLARTSSLEMSADQTRHQSHSQRQNANLIRLKKSALNTFVFYIFIIVCYVPKSFSMITFIIAQSAWEKWSNAWIFANTLVFFNSSVNPLLYCWRIRELRAAVLKLWEMIFPRTTAEDS